MADQFVRQIQTSGHSKCPETIHISLRQRTPAVAVLRETVSSTPGPLQADGVLKVEVQFKNRLFSLDATLIKLCASLFDKGNVSPDQERREASPAAGS
jgi:hypothetical protein